jgi:hypothetical protein
MSGFTAQYTQYVPLLIPIVLLELGLMTFALIDLNKRASTRGSKWVWILLIVLLNLIGPIAYLLVGRWKEADGDHSPAHEGPHPTEQTMKIRTCAVQPQGCPPLADCDHLASSTSPEHRLGVSSHILG